MLYRDSCNISAPKYTFYFIRVNCFQVCTFNEIFIALFLAYVCQRIYSYTAIMKIKWDSKESSSWVMQMMIIKMWCVAIIAVVAASACKFNIPLLLRLKNKYIMQYKQTWEGIIFHIIDNLEEHRGELLLKSPCFRIKLLHIQFPANFQQHDSEYQE